MTQYEFDKLMEKYLRGECTPEEEFLLNNWAARQLDTVPQLPKEDLPQLAKKQVWKRLQHSTRLTNPVLHWFSWPKLGIAATIVLAVSAFLWWQNEDDSIQNTAAIRPKGVSMTNTTNTPQNITLNDGSIVTLQPQSSITFPEKFGHHDRKVYLRGEGFFKVTRMEHKPFYVFAGKLVTKVLGTSFKVKYYENDPQTEVSVVSGKVKVYPSEAQQEWKIVTPNQKIIYDKTAQELHAEVVEQPVYVNPPNSPANLVFEETPLVEVLKKMEKVYGLDIAADAKLANCTFSGDLNDLDLYLQLELICKSINAQVEKRETSLFLIGMGCD